MNPRVKKLIALAIMLPAIMIYFFAAAALGEYVPDFWLLKVIYYIIAGLAWAFPIRILLLWANAENAPDRDK